MDPQQRHVLETSYEALFNAGGAWQGHGGFSSLGTKNGLKWIEIQSPRFPAILVNSISMPRFELQPEES